jgi:general stress protein 26
MQNSMLNKLRQVLENREFISVATISPSGRPNAAPKFFLKIESKHIYLIDYTMGRTWENLKTNHHISLSVMDTGSLVGYQINGIASIIESGHEYEQIFKEVTLKEIDLSAKRIIEGVVKGQKHKNFELGIRDKFAILKVSIHEIIAIGTSGEIKREELES